MNERVPFPIIRKYEEEVKALSRQFRAQTIRDYYDHAALQFDIGTFGEIQPLARQPLAEVVYQFEQACQRQHKGLSVIATNRGVGFFQVTEAPQLELEL